MEKKGLSPIIASVILIAFVLAVAVLASTFFTTFTKWHAGQIEEEGRGVTECSLGNLEIDPDTVYVDEAAGTIRVVVESGRIDLQDVVIVAWNETGAFEQTTSPSTVPKNSVITLTSGHPNGTVSRITVRTACPEVSAEVEDEDGDGVWESVY
jgi:flagellin-like protein